MSFIYSILAFTIGLSLVSILIPSLIRVSKAKHLYDTPNERKVTKEIVPSVGGVAIFIAFLIGTIIAINDYSFRELKYLIVAVLLLFFLGLKDDLVDLSAKKKLLVQVVVSTILIILGGIRFTDLHGIFGLYNIDYALSFVVTLLVMIFIINSLNLIDGIDGLASSIGIVASFIFGSWFLLAGHPEYGIMCFSLAGSLTGFFFFNVFGKNHKIFMGDSGSLVIGVILVVVVIKFNEFNIAGEVFFHVNASPAVAISILIVPIIDTLRVIFIRLYAKKSPFAADMSHIHHSCLKLTNSHLHATLLIVLFNILIIGLALTLKSFFEINVLMAIILGIGLIISSLPDLILKYADSRLALKPALNSTNEKNSKRSGATSAKKENSDNAIMSSLEDVSSKN
jgi:UDP-N-acetylmuramyl pentapeptide phosphotransferase/UDP-N-acetylglucosamine-1-phosphate transferase